MGCFATLPKYNCNHIPVLLFMIVILQLFDSAVFAKPQLFGGHVKDETDSPSDGVLRIVRIYKLYNHCSRKHVQIFGSKHVDAKARERSEWTKLRVETDTFESQVRIQSNNSRNYLCFNKKGRLTVRHSGKNRKCVFKEVHTDLGFTEFQSVANPMWKIGFKANGKPLRGDQYKKRRKLLECYRYTKTDFDPYQVNGDKPSRPVYGPKDVDFSKFWKAQQRDQR